jgi:hypothetical protein
LDHVQLRFHLERFAFAKYANLTDTDRVASMRIKITSRRISSPIALGIVLLAFALFGWGVKYKLSLYDPPGSLSTRIPQAKLLSQKERPALFGDTDSFHPVPPQPNSSVLFPAFLIASVLLGSSVEVSFRIGIIPDDDMGQQRCAHSSFFSFRPPPALIPSI